MREALPHTPPSTAPRNRYDLREWAGAFGDLGTLLPFAVAYLTVVRIDPMGLLLAFGCAMVATGLYYRTPFPVQPMKAIGAAATVQAAQGQGLTPEAVHVAALATALLWLALGLSPLAQKVARRVPAAVVSGIVLGLGLSFMLQGVQLMRADWAVALVGVAGTLLLMRWRGFPAIFLLLAFGLAVGAWQRPDLFAAVADLRPALRMPPLPFSGGVGWHEVFVGVVLLALPQVPLTLGNAVVAVTQANNRQFPHAPVTEQRVAVSTGLMNLFSSAVGGVPMCHGAGGMAGHTAFGARTGGALVILGALLLVLGVFFSGSVSQLFGLFPAAVLGVMLLLSGLQLCRGGWTGALSAPHAWVAFATAGLALWNVGAALVGGMLLSALATRLGRRPGRDEPPAAPGS